MPPQIASPLAIFTLFALGVEAVVGLVLGLSDGLSELHKTVLVSFVVGYPVVAMLLFLRLAAKSAQSQVLYLDPESRVEGLGHPPVFQTHNSVHPRG